jgi:hypothetical protein
MTSRKGQVKILKIVANVAACTSCQWDKKMFMGLAGNRY